MQPSTTGLPLSHKVPCLLQDMMKIQNCAGPCIEVVGEFLTPSIEGILVRLFIQFPNLSCKEAMACHCQLTLLHTTLLWYGTDHCCEQNKDSYRSIHSWS